MSEKDFNSRVLVVGGIATLMTEEQIQEKYTETQMQTINMDTAKYEALNKVDEMHASFLRNLTGDATVEERDTWQSKELAARALAEYEDATVAQTEMLTIEASYLGVTPIQLAETVIAKANLFKKLTGLAAGVRGKARAAIKAATTPEQLKTATDTAQADVQAALATFAGV